MDKEDLAKKVEKTSERAFFHMYDIGGTPAYKPGNLSEAIHFIYAMHEEPLTQVDDLAFILDKAYDDSSQFDAMQDLKALGESYHPIRDTPYYALHMQVFNYLQFKTAIDSLGYDSLEEAEKDWNSTLKTQVDSIVEAYRHNPEQLMKEFEEFEDLTFEANIENVMEPHLFDDSDLGKKEFRKVQLVLENILERYGAAKKF